MNRILLLSVLMSALSATRAEERVPREEALKAALFLSIDLKQMLATPIPTDPDVKRPIAIRRGERGVLVMPECKLSAATIASAARDEVIPVGQLWLRGVSLQVDGERPAQDKLLSVAVADKTLHLCALGVRKATDGKPELLIYGKGKEPLLRVTLKSISEPAEDLLTLTGEPQDGGALLKLGVCGKYEARFPVQPE